MTDYVGVLQGNYAQNVLLVRAPVTITVIDIVSSRAKHRVRKDPASSVILHARSPTMPCLQNAVNLMTVAWQQRAAVWKHLEHDPSVRNSVLPIVSLYTPELNLAIPRLLFFYAAKLGPLRTRQARQAAGQYARAKRVT